MRHLALPFLLTLPLFASACGKSKDAQADDSSGSKDSKSGCPAKLSGTITQSTVITKDCGEVIIEGPVNVHGDLTLEAGARLVATDGAALWVASFDTSGQLIVNGTADAPVTISGASKSAGAWEGIVLGAASARTKIDHLVIEHAGAGDKPALTIDGEAVTIGALTVRDSKGPAVDISFAGPTALTSLSVSNVGAPALRTTAEAAGSVAALAGEGAEAHIVSGQFSRDSKLAAIGAPWVLTSDVQVGGDESTPAVLTVAPGAELKFTESGALTVGYYQTGKLVLAGEVEHPIRLGSARDAAVGAWRGLYVGEKGTVEAKHVEVADAGRDGAAAIDLGEGARLSYVDGLITNSSVGVRARSGKTTLAVSETGFTGVPLAFDVSPENFAGVGAGNRYDEAARIAVAEGQIERDVAWTPQAAVVELHGSLSINDAKLSVGGGKYQVADGATIIVGYYKSGTLELIGTAEQPVELFGTREEAGIWGPITVAANSGTRAVLEHVILRDVGGAAGVVVDEQGSAKIDDLRCDRCAATLQWTCNAKVEASNVSAGTDTATAELAPEGCG